SKNGNPLAGDGGCNHAHTKDRKRGCLAVKDCASGLLTRNLLTLASINRTTKRIFLTALRRLFCVKMHFGLNVRDLGVLSLRYFHAKP
ncbi:MAG: hypothetical protein AAFO91_17235, partial [Bacteroidota bacterium]